jgi:exodeoxyribonuclease VII small subunit
MPRKKSRSFEESLAGLETIVQSMEKGDMPLADLMENYKKGRELSQECLKALTCAEKAMDIMVKDDGGNVQKLELTIEGD